MISDLFRKERKVGVYFEDSLNSGCDLFLTTKRFYLIFSIMSMLIK